MSLKINFGGCFPSEIPPEKSHFPKDVVFSSFSKCCFGEKKSLESKVVDYELVGSPCLIGHHLFECFLNETPICKLEFLSSSYQDDCCFEKKDFHGLPDLRM